MKFLSLTAAAVMTATLPHLAAAAAASAAAPAASASSAQCTQVCCDAVVPSIAPGGNVGIHCAPGFDCAFGLQVTACCARLSFGQAPHTGIGCSVV